VTTFGYFLASEECQPDRLTEQVLPRLNAHDKEDGS
jgi:hypothetical protein